MSNRAMSSQRGCSCCVLLLPEKARLAYVNFCPPLVIVGCMTAVSKSQKLVKDWRGASSVALHWVTSSIRI